MWILVLKINLMLSSSCICVKNRGQDLCKRKKKKKVLHQIFWSQLTLSFNPAVMNPLRQHKAHKTTGMSSDLWLPNMRVWTPNISSRQREAVSAKNFTFKTSSLIWPSRILSALKATENARPQTLNLWWQTPGRVCDCFGPVADTHTQLDLNTHQELGHP